MKINYDKYFNTLQETPKSIPKSLPIQSKASILLGTIWNYCVLRLLTRIPTHYLDKALERQIGSPPSKSKQARKEALLWHEAKTAGIQEGVNIKLDELHV